MAQTDVQFDESTAVPVAGAQPAGVTFDDSTAVTLPKASASPAPAAPRPPDTISAAPPLTWSERARQSVANSVIGRNLQSAAPGVAEALHLQPTDIPGTQGYEQETGSLPAVMPLLPEWAKKPLLQEPSLTSGNPAERMAAQESAYFRQAHPIAGAVTQGISETVEGLTSPANLAMIAAAPESKVISGIFAAQAAQGSFDNAEQAYQAWRQGKNPEAAKKLTESGLDAVVAGLAGRQTLKGAFPVDTARPAVSEPLATGGGFEQPQLTAGAPTMRPPVEFPPDTPALPIPPEARGQLPATTAGEAPPNPQNSPPPFNASTAVERTTPPTQFAPRPEIPANKGVIVDAQGNALVNRPALPSPRDTAARKTPIIPKIVPPPAPVPQAPPQPTSNAVMVSPPSNIQPAPESPQAAPQTPPATIPPAAAPNVLATPEAGQRPAVQASTDPAQLRQSAQQQQPALEQMAGQVAAAVPGAEVVGPRVKTAESIENKDDRGKAPETNIDNLAVRVVAPSPDAVPAVQQAIESQLPVVSKDTIDSNGLNIPQYAVQTGKPGDPNQVSELQVVPGPATAKAMKETDPLYARQKEALAEAKASTPGSWRQKAAQKEAEQLGAQISGLLDKAKAQDAKAAPKKPATPQVAAMPGMTPMGAQPAAGPKPLVKGTPVTLKDGTKGTIKGGNPNEPNGGRWMVTTPKGSVLANGKDLKTEAPAEQVPQPVQQGQPAPGAPRPVGKPLMKRIEHIKALVAKGQKVVIFSVEADNPMLHEALQKVGLGSLPVTNIKGPDFGALLDNEVNVPTNADEPMEIPEIPAGKALYVDFDGTLFTEPGGVEKQEAKGGAEGATVTSGDVRGQTGYSIASADGTPVGKLRVEQIAPGKVEIKGSGVRIQGEGYGRKLYEEAIKQEAAKGNVVVSDQDAGEHEAQTSPEAAHVWDSLVRRGMAKKTGNTYESIKPEGAPANEQRDSAEQPANSVANGGQEEAQGAIQKPAAAQVDERQPGQGGREDGGRVQPVQQGVEPARESAVKPGGEADRKEEVEPKFKHGNTQADIPPGSDAGKALARMRKAILPEDLAGDGMVNDSHITVRYGIDGGDTAGIRAYLEKQVPFEATLGKTQAFPPSEHSDGAAPIVAPVESADLRRMEKEIDKHGNFVERSFPEYKPHATLAYVKPEEAKRYTGMTEADGKTFTVKSISITDRDGNSEEVKLKGTAKPTFSAAARAKAKKAEDVPASQTAIEQHRAAHVPGAFARLVTEHGHAADALVKLMRDPKADPKELAAAAAKVDKLAPEVEKESPGGGPIYAEDYGYVKRGTEPKAELPEPKVGDTVTVHLGGRDYPNTVVTNIANGKYGVDVFGFKYVDRSDVVDVKPKTFKAPVVDEAHEQAKTDRLQRDIDSIQERKPTGTPFSVAARERAGVMDRPARTDAIGKPGVEVPAKYEPKPNESSTVATAPKKPESLTERFKRAQQAKADKYLDTHVRRADNSITTRRAIIDERMAGGGTTSIKQVQDDAAERKLDRELGVMRRAGVPTGNQSHPTTIKYNELRAQQKAGIKVPSYRIHGADGTEWVVSKTEHDYAQSIEGKELTPDEPKPKATDAGRLAIMRSEAEPVLDIHRKPTGWLQYDSANARTLVHPTENSIVRFESKDFKSGTALLRAKAEAQAYAIDHPIERAESKPAGDLVVKPIFGNGKEHTITPEDRTAMEAKPASAKPTFSNAARERAGLKPVTRAVVKAETDAVAPGTAPPSRMEELQHQADSLSKQERQMWDSQRLAERDKDKKGVEYFKKEREKLSERYNRVDAELRLAKDEFARAQRWAKVPLTTPEEKVVTDPDQNKWKYQAEYFVKALEPVKQAWIDKLPAWSWESLVNPKTAPSLVGVYPNGFPDDFIRIEVPNDGKFLVKNTPAAIDKLLKSAPRAFAKPGKAPGQTPRSIPRAPKELENEKLIAHHRAQIDELEKDLRRAGDAQRPYYQEQLQAARQNLADAEQAAKEGGTALTSLSPGQISSAARLSLRENAARAVARALPKTDSDYAGQIVLNPNAYIIIQRDAELGGGGHWNGIILGAEKTKDLLAKLKDIGKKSGSLSTSNSLRSLAAIIDGATVSKGGVAILYAGDPLPVTTHEEVTHSWQITEGPHVSKAIAGSILNSEIGKEFRPVIEEMGYDVDKEVVASEIAAKAATGQLQGFGATDKQVHDLLVPYFDAIASELGVETLDSMPVFTKTTQEALDEVREKYAKSERDLQPEAGNARPADTGTRPSEASPNRDIQKNEQDKAELTQLRKPEPGATAGASDRAGVGKPSDLGTKFYTGFADPQLFNRLFPDIGDRMADWLSDAPGHGDTQRAMMRETRGEMDRKVAIAIHKLKDASKEWRTRTRDDSMKFWNAVESGTVDTLAPRDQALANLFKGAFDSMRGQLQALKPEVLQDYIENYFPHIWERPSQVSATIKALITGKKPFAGKGSFLKQRTIPTMQDGIDLGFKPVSWNPVDSFLTKYAEMAQFLMGHQTLKMMQDSGTAKMVRIGKQPPEGWTQLDDRIGTVQNYDDEGHLYIRGHYYAPAEAARIFNNFVSRGMAGRSTIYDTLNWANQNLNALQLGISAFHASTTSINAATSDVALGIQQLAEGKPLRAGFSLAKGASVFPSLLHTMVNGSRLMREYLTPGSYAKMAEEAKSLASAGGRIRQNTIELKPLDKVINAWRNGAVLEGLTPIPGAILHAAVAPVMDYYVPRMKLGAFYAMAHNILDSAQRGGWSDGLVRSRMQEAWDSIDNRFGQVVYENLFWHKGVRDALNLATRSVGWNFGSYRELGGAVADVSRQAGRAASGQVPRVTPRLAFGIALPLVSALLGGILTYLWTGKRPDEWKDYFYPKTANGERHSIPGYMKDVFSFQHAPGKTVLNKMAPIWEATSEAIENRDFYGTEIRHKDDPLMAQLGQFSRWAGSQAVPFSVSGAAKLLQQRGAGPSLQEMLQEAKKHPGDVALGQLGFQPAPAFIQNSPAMNMARDYQRENRPPGTKTAEQAEHYKAMDSIVRMYRENDVDQDQIDRLVSEGKVTDRDVLKAERESDEDPMVRAVKNLTIEQMLNVWQVATPAERDTIEPVLRRHERDIDKIADDEEQEKMQEAFDKAMDQIGQQQPITDKAGVI